MHKPLKLLCTSFLLLWATSVHVHGSYVEYFICLLAQKRASAFQLILCFLRRALCYKPPDAQPATSALL